MKKQSYSTALLILLATFNFGCIHAEETVQKQRHIELEGQSNFRDIGGYKTLDNKTVKLKTIYRSGELPRLSDKDVTKLDKLGIATVVNFLSNDEITARGHDRIPKGAKELFFPISGEVDNDLAKVVLEARQTADFSKVPVLFNTEIHRLLVGNASKKQYAGLIKVAANPENHPLVFHCSHGVHRTGTATAILLSALGVPWDTVRNDYLLSNVYRKDEVEERTLKLRNIAAKKQGISPSEVDMTNINAFYILEASYIDATIDQIKKVYGSMENYLHKGLGLKNEDIQKLRDALLE